ncbi:MAG TPA: hypothetical protein VHP11_14890 [Tepidisphaeraceae bacterium]|nr:hypothetical protein [Tepidisphaeraceae bacterium]
MKITVEFMGDGTIRPISPGLMAFTGGVRQPQLDGNVKFLVHREVRDEDGIMNPVDGEGSVEGGFQINIWANSEGYRELARYFLGLAELDASADSNFHEHHAGLMSADGRTQLHIICRKPQIVEDSFPA